MGEVEHIVTRVLLVVSCAVLGWLFITIRSKFRDFHTWKNEVSKLLFDKIYREESINKSFREDIHRLINSMDGRFRDYRKECREEIFRDIDRLNGDTNLDSKEISKLHSKIEYIEEKIKKLEG